MNTADDQSNTRYPGKQMAVGLDIDQLPHSENLLLACVICAYYERISE